MAKRKTGACKDGARALDTIETGSGPGSVEGVPAAGAPNGNRQRGARSGWAARRSRTKPSERPG
jgi:hypothetical protein